MKILITGGNGFIARSLVDSLKSKYDISSYTKTQLDLLDTKKVFDCIKRSKFDVVIHTATYDAAPFFSTKDPSIVLENNLKMFFNIVRCGDYYGKMIYFGSGAEFGRENWIPKMKEDYFDKYVPIDQYGLSKYIMTKYTVANKNIYNLRLFGVFGKFDDWRYRFIPNACLKATLNLPLTINQNKYYDYLYIDDLVKIVEWVITKNPNRNVYNICTGVVYDLKTIAEKVLQISGKDLEIVVHKAGLGKEYSGDNNLLLNELGEFRFRPMDESIKILLDWYEINKKSIKEIGGSFI